MTPEKIAQVVEAAEIAAVAKVVFSPGTTAEAWAVVGSAVGVAAIAVCEHGHPSRGPIIDTVAVTFDGEQWARIRELARFIASRGAS